MKKAISGIMLTLLLTSILMFAFNIKQAESSEPPATEWSRTYGGTDNDVAMSVVQTNDGGYALAGHTRSFGAGDRDFWLVKTDADGNHLWNQTYGGTNTDHLQSMVQTTDGGYALAGETQSFGAGSRDIWLVKTNSFGNHKWNRTYGGTNEDYSEAMVQTSDAGYALAGGTRSFGVGGWDIWLVKTNSTGHMEWNQTYGGTNDEWAASVVQTSDGGYALAGRSLSFGAGSWDFWLVKTDADGNHQWNITYGGTNQDGARTVVQTVDGGYALTGWTFSFGAGDEDFWLVKTDADGNHQWNQTYGGTDKDDPHTVAQTFDGGYVMAGYTDSFGEGRDAWLVKTDSSGTHEWNVTSGGTSREQAVEVVQTIDGGFAIAGYTESFGIGAQDFWLIKIAPEEISATVNIKPDTLNLKSKGKLITCYIELPGGYDVNDIDATTIMLNDTVPAELHPTEVGDHDGDGIPDLMVKFSRAAVIQLILSSIDPSEFEYQKPPFFIERVLTVIGQLYDETPFEGNDSIRVMFKFSIL